MVTIKAGATSQTIDVFIQDSSSTTGAGLGGLVFNSSGLTCYYRRGATGSATAVTLATQTVGGAYSSGGFVEIDATNMKGVYRLDLPDAIVASGVPYATIVLRGATNMAPVAVRIEMPTKLVSDLNDIAATAIVSSGAITTSSGAVTTVTTVGSVTAVGTGGITAGSFAAGAIDAAAIAADAIGSSELATTAVNEIRDAILSDSTAFAGANIDATVSSRATPAQVNTEVVDALATDTYAEPGQETPAATSSLANKINYLFKAWRNKKTQTSTTFSLFADDAATVDQKATTSDDGTTTTVGEVATGP